MDVPKGRIYRAPWYIHVPSPASGITATATGVVIDAVVIRLALV
jgi:hypothetical protein